MMTIGDSFERQLDDGSVIRFTIKKIYIDPKHDLGQVIYLSSSREPDKEITLSYENLVSWFKISGWAIIKQPAT